MRGTFGKSSWRGSVALRWAVGAVALGGVALFAACLQATQIDAELSSDKTICARGGPAGATSAPAPARYAIRVRHLDSDDRMDVRTSDGTFDRCESAKDSAYLGSFTVLPETEDGREHRQLIQVMVDVDGNDPELCSDIDENGKRVDLPRNCIVLRRHVRFVEHEGFRIPMYLDDRCLGVSCEEDSTCFRGGCVDAKAPCDLAAGTCVPEAQRALGPNGAGFDPSKRALPPGVSAIDDAGNVTYEDGAVVEGGALPDGALAPTEDGAVTDATTDSSAPADAGASTDAADAGSVGDTPVASCSLCGARQCCSAAGKPPLFCRTTCNVGETECVRSDASNAINCEAPPPPPF